MACTISWHLQNPPLQALEGPGEEASVRPWRVGFMVLLLGALCYTICTMKAPPQGLGRSLHGINFTISWHLQKPPLQALSGPGEETSWYSCFVLCAIQYAP